MEEDRGRKRRIREIEELGKESRKIKEDKEIRDKER